MLEIPSEHVAAAIEAMKHDSQNGVLGAPGSDHITITDEHWARIDQIFRDFDVPFSSKMSPAEFISKFEGY